MAESEIEIKEKESQINERKTFERKTFADHRLEYGLKWAIKVKGD